MAVVLAPAVVVGVVVEALAWLFVGALVPGGAVGEKIPGKLAWVGADGGVFWRVAVLPDRKVSSMVWPALIVVLDLQSDISII